jgi:hypothetical protein
LATEETPLLMEDVEPVDAADNCQTEEIDLAAGLLGRVVDRAGEFLQMYTDTATKSAN